ncbi:hypothetical protein ANN_19668 [Periplaneta americana]|uniref:Uncharacterized protein n=1 Tax=Periplaneta americana TaxID=6978 RepID=A0ABQ8SB65_PERAM|nr:hypothetical protein ANN_19668 [Periplaneta americana]
MAGLCGDVTISAFSSNQVVCLYHVLLNGADHYCKLQLIDFNGHEKPLDAQKEVFYMTPNLMNEPVAFKPPKWHRPGPESNPQPRAQKASAIPPPPPRATLTVGGARHERRRIQEE